MEHVYIMDYANCGIYHKTFPDDIDPDDVVEWIGEHFNLNNIEWMVSDKDLEIEEYED